MDEQELVKRCLSKDPFGNTPGVASPWEEFQRRYRPLLAKAVSSTLQKFGGAADPARVDDGIQDIFLYLIRDDFQALRRFQPGRPLAPYLTGIAAYRAVDGLRSREAQKPEETPGARARLLRDLAEQAEAAEREALRHADRGEQREGIERALDALSGRERLALRLFYWDDVPAETIGRMLGLRADAVRALLARTRARLRKLLALLFFAGLSAIPVTPGSQAPYLPAEPCAQTPTR